MNTDCVPAPREEKKDPMRDLFPDLPVIQGKTLCLRPLELKDAPDLLRLTKQEIVYRYLPTYLYEKQSGDMEKVIRGLYSECLEDSLILGIFRDRVFRGLAEVYGYRAPLHKASVGYRLLQEAWGQGIATEALGLLTGELRRRRSVEIITASTMLENRASARVLEKNGFTLVAHGVGEDWGYPLPTPADKWVL